MSIAERINYIATGETIGIWVTVDGEEVLFVKESHMREKIAKEVEAIPYWGYQDKFPDGQVINYISQPDVASIVRGA